MLKIHSLPENQEKSTLFDIKLNGIAVTAEFARVSAMPFNTPWPGHQRDISQTEESGFISFEGDEKVILEVTSAKEIETALIRPISKNIKVDIISKNTVRFELAKVGNYVLEINGQHNPLHIFFNPVRDFAAEAKAEKESGRTVYYYGKGVHNIGDLEISSHTTVTVDAGAVVYGSISAFSADDIKINGYGVLDGSLEIRTSKNLLLPLIRNTHENSIYFTENKESFDAFMNETSCLKGLIRFYFSENISCEGVILRDCSTFCVVPAACENAVFDNIKTIGMWRYNSDGIDVFNSSDIVIKNCFIRNFDDAIVIKGIIGWDFRSNENIVVDNCVIWCDWGAACEIGAETNAPEYKNIAYRNCDIIHDSAGAMMRIHHHNYADIHDISYENMHCEFCKDQMNSAIQRSDDEVYEYKPKTEQPALLDVVMPDRVLYGRDAQKGKIHDISFNNIFIHADEEIADMLNMHIYGYTEDCTVKNVELKNFYINGKRVDDFSKLNMQIGKYAYDIKCK